MSLRTTTATVGEATVLSIEGIVDLSTVGQLHMDLTAAIRRHPGVDLVVDLDGVAAVDDTGLGVLLGAAASTRDAGGSLTVVTTNERLLARLGSTRFDRAVDVRSTIA